MNSGLKLNMTAGQKRTSLNAGFKSIREGYLTHKDERKTVSALFSKLVPCDPTPYMVYKGSGNCSPAGMSFANLLIHDDIGDSKAMIGYVIQAIYRLDLAKDRRNRLVASFIAIIDKSGKAEHPGLVHAKDRLQLLLPSEMRQAA